MYKKILTISLLIIILISIFSVNCYASTFNLEFNFSDKGYDLPDINVDLPVEFKYFILIKSSSFGHLFYAAEEPPVFSFFRSSDSSYKFYVESGLVAEFILKDNATEWDFNGYGNVPYTSGLHYKVNYLYSNSDIKYNDKLIVEGYGTPLVRSVRSIKTLDSVLNETISILPITLSVVVGLVAIRKGISFITKKIRNS